MKSWKRITLVIFVLIGGTMFFGYWSINQFDVAFGDLSASYLASTHSVYSSFKQNTGSASTSPEISRELAISTSSGQATSTDLALSFTFPQEGDEAYIGCTYQVSWQSSITINSLETALIDAGTGKSMRPIASGLAKENTIETDSQNLEWKVGVVWPGAYYIMISKINGIETEFRSKSFEISKVPEGIDEEKKIIICRESSV
jgi:hypothetical protein